MFLSSIEPLPELVCSGKQVAAEALPSMFATGVTATPLELELPADPLEDELPLEDEPPPQADKKSVNEASAKKLIIFFMT